MMLVGGFGLSCLHVSWVTTWCRWEASHVPTYFSECQLCLVIRRLFVCLNVLFGGGYLAAGITRLLRDVLKQKALWGPWEKAGIVTTDVCVRLPVCVLGAVDYANVAAVKGRGRVFLSHRQSLLLSAVLVNEDLLQALALWTVTLFFWEGLFMSLGSRLVRVESWHLGREEWCDTAMVSPATGWRKGAFKWQGTRSLLRTMTKTISRPSWKCL